MTEATQCNRTDSDRTKTVTGLLEGRNWSWCLAVLVFRAMSPRPDQVTVQDGIVIDVRDPE